jgi:hypothetical protein
MSSDYYGTIAGETADRGAEDTPEPCQCMTSFAAISPIHSGHCCFLPATQTCHPEEVAEWERGRDRAMGRETEVRHA